MTYLSKWDSFHLISQFACQLTPKECHSVSQETIYNFFTFKRAYSVKSAVVTLILR